METLSQLAQLPRPNVLARAGKSLSGAMSAALASKIQNVILQCRAADHSISPCLAPDCRPDQDIAWLCILYAESEAVSAANGSMLPGFPFDSSRESTLIAARNYLHSAFGLKDSSPFLGGEFQQAGALCLAVACSVPNILDWHQWELWRLGPCTKILSAAAHRISTLQRPTVKSESSIFVTGECTTRLVENLALPHSEP